MDTLSYQYKAIVWFKLFSRGFKTRIKPKGIFSKKLVEIYVRNINNDMIKSSDNGGLDSVVD